MRLMLRRLLLCVLACLALAGPASAATIIVKLGLAPGKLQVASARATGSTVAVTVADGRGNGAGWTLRASQAVAITGITARCASNSTCTLPTARTTPSGSVVLTAAKGTGMGIVNLTVTLGSAPSPGLSFTVS